MKTNSLIYTARKEKKGIIYKVKIKLADECKNGHEDFSATIEYGTPSDFARGNTSGGCAHDVIIEHFPGLKIFCDLHLCDWKGYPMHGIANAYYFYQQGQFDVLKDTLRASDEQIEEIKRLAPEDKHVFEYRLEQMGFRSRMQNQAAIALAELERLTGKEFESLASRSNWPEMDTVARKRIQRRISSGYYSPEKIAARAKAAKDKARRKLLASIKEDAAKAILKIKEDAAIRLFFARRDLCFKNVIFYTHTRTLTFNYSDSSSSIYGHKWTQEDFIDFIHGDLSGLPEGIKFEIRCP